MKKNLFKVFNIWRLIPGYLCVLTASHSVKNIITEDILYWGKCSKRKEKSKFGIFSGLILENKEFRNLLILRFKQEYARERVRVRSVLHLIIFNLFFPKMETLFINTLNIGRRLYIQHGFATIISAKSIGDDCWINQQVTIGYDFDPNPPIIGNGVRISAGAKVIGQIEVEDNVIIAANAVVVKDVSANEIVGGVPARKIGENINHKLHL